MDALNVCLACCRLRQDDHSKQPAQVVQDAAQHAGLRLTTHPHPVANGATCKAVCNVHLVPDGQRSGRAAVLKSALNIFKPTAVLLLPILALQLNSDAKVHFDGTRHALKILKNSDWGSTKIFAWPCISKGSQGHLFM